MKERWCTLLFFASKSVERSKIVTRCLGFQTSLSLVSRLRETLLSSLFRVCPSILVLRAYFRCYLDFSEVI